jgi:hypothetical protein
MFKKNEQAPKYGDSNAAQKDALGSLEAFPNIATTLTSPNIKDPRGKANDKASEPERPLRFNEAPEAQDTQSRNTHTDEQ